MKKQKQTENDRLDLHTDYYVHVPRSWLRFMWILPILTIGLFLSPMLGETHEISFSAGGSDWILGGYVLTAYLIACIFGYLVRGEKFIAGFIAGLIMGFIAGLIMGFIAGLIAGFIAGFIMGFINED